MKNNKINKIEVRKTDKGISDIDFFFVEDNYPYSSREFRKGSKTRKILERIEKEILETYEN